MKTVPQKSKMKVQRKVKETEDEDDHKSIIGKAGFYISIKLN